MDRTPASNFDYVRWRWTLLPAAARRFWKGAGALLLLVWLAGALAAAHSVAALAAMDPAPRLLLAAGVGPGGLALWWLELQGLYRETAADPAPWWLGILFLNGLTVALLGGRLFAEAGTAERNAFRQHRHRLAQGRLEEGEILARVPTARGVPLALAGGREPATVSVPYAGGEGHVLVVAPTRAGKSLHLTEALLAWPGPVVCLDPKSEQLRRTAGERAKLGPVYNIPGYSLRLADYYNLADGDDLAELHYHLLKPWQSREPIFANKSKPLFAAIAAYAAAHGLDPLRALLDAAASDPVALLLALERVALRDVRAFTNGLRASEYVHDRFATSAFGTFSTQLSDYQKHVETIAPGPGRPVIPRHWALHRSSLYITYSLNDLRGVSGVVAAILAALMRQQLQRGPGLGLLVAIDEFPAVELANANTYLATVGGAGVTMLLYAQNVAQLRALYGPDGAQALLGNCKHQVWYAPADPETARHVSELYGTALVPAQTRTHTRGIGREAAREQQGVSESLVVQPALPPTAVMSLPKEQVVVQTESDRLYRFLGRRLNPLPRLAALPPPPPLPTPPAAGERTYTVWETGPPPAVEDELAGATSGPPEAPEQTQPPAEAAAPEGPATDAEAAPADCAVAPPEEHEAPPLDLRNFFGTTSDEGV
jgi:type IV secretion system protein VirD4